MAEARPLNLSHRFPFPQSPRQATSPPSHPSRPSAGAPAGTHQASTPPAAEHPHYPATHSPRSCGATYPQPQQPLPRYSARRVPRTHARGGSRLRRGRGGIGRRRRGTWRSCVWVCCPLFEGKRKGEEERRREELSVFPCLFRCRYRQTDGLICCSVGDLINFVLYQR